MKQWILLHVFSLSEGVLGEWIWGELVVAGRQEPSPRAAAVGTRGSCCPSVTSSADTLGGPSTGALIILKAELWLPLGALVIIWTRQCWGLGLKNPCPAGYSPGGGGHGALGATLSIQHTPYQMLSIWQALVHLIFLTTRRTNYYLHLHFTNVKMMESVTCSRSHRP